MRVLLGLIGGNMMVAPVPHVPAAASMGAIVVIIADAAAASLRPSSRAAPGARPQVPGAPPPRASARWSGA